MMGTKNQKPCQILSDHSQHFRWIKNELFWLLKIKIIEKRLLKSCIYGTLNAIRGCRNYCCSNLRRCQTEQMNHIVIMFVLEIVFFKMPGISSNPEVILNTLSSEDLRCQKVSKIIQYVTGWYNCQFNNCNCQFFSFFTRLRQSALIQKFKFHSFLFWP